MKDHSLHALRAQAAETSGTLGPYLALYQIHSATLDSPVLGDPTVLDDLARMRDRGIRIGITVSGAAQAEVARRALAIERGGAPLFDAIQDPGHLEPARAIVRAGAAGGARRRTRGPAEGAARERPPLPQGRALRLQLTGGIPEALEGLGEDAAGYWRARAALPWS